jgi:hypothetical protein
MAYWFTSFAIASIAACLMGSGAPKSGNPCARFTAPYFIAWRVISRITDSVNRLAFSDTLDLRETVVIGSRGSDGFAPDTGAAADLSVCLSGSE